MFLTFLKLGLTSFGGPIAHVGYFHRAFVEERRASFADFAIALVGFAMLRRINVLWTLLWCLGAGALSSHLA